jgi:hypothetical protein
MVIYEEANKVRVEYDASAKVHAIHWFSLHGPHYRKAIEAMIAHMRKNATLNYISDSSAAKDVQTQEDLEYVKVAAGHLAQAGVKRFVVVMPASAIAKMGANKVVKTAADVGIERHVAPNYDEALRIIRGAKAA